MLALRDDLREALRRVRRNPRLTLLAVGTLALGIGAATAVFTMAHTLLYAPPPFREPDRIVALDGRTPRARWSVGVSYADMRDYVADNLVDAAALVSYGEFSWTGQSLPGFDGAEVLRGLSVTRGYFRVFDQPMALGRGFAAEEGQPGHDSVVIAYALWQRRFAGRADIIGQTMTLNGRLHTIVGVAGARFLTYDSYEVLAWVPFVPTSLRHEERGWTCFARLASGLSIEQARHRIDALTARIAPAIPDRFRDYYKGYTVHVKPLLSELHEEARPALLALVAAVVCLLLIAAANVASLLLAKATTEAREMAIRAALGAGRLRLFRMMVAQSIVLALLASIGGVLIAVWLLDGARALMPPSLQWDWAFAIDGRIFVAAFLVSALAGLAAGLAPAFENFRLAAGGLRPLYHRSRMLRVIVTAEIALAVFLSVGAGLLGKSFVGLLNRPLGYETENLLGMRVRLEGERYQTVEQKGDYWSQLVERAGSLPGTAKAACVSDLPMGWQYIGGNFDIDGHAAPPGERRPSAHQLAASPGYFATVGIPILAGRGFTDGDGPRSEPVAVVNDLLAQTFWPGQNAIGKMIRPMGGSWRRVVGVVRRIRHGGPADSYQNEIYMSYRQFNQETMFLVIRGRVPAESLVPAIRATLKSIDADVPAFEIRTVTQAFAREVAGPRLPMVMTTFFATLALLLAGLGLFGVIAYWVSQRVREMGVRAALGAQPRELRALVLRQGGRLMAIGLALGLAGSLAAMRVLRSLLYGMSERDVYVYLGAISVAVVTTVLACWLPAARAARIEPATALREQG